MGAHILPFPSVPFRFLSLPSPGIQEAKPPEIFFELFLASDTVCPTPCGKIKPVMKNIQTFFRNVTRKTRPVHQQLELPLPGSRLTRDEASFLIEIRRLREQLATITRAASAGARVAAVDAASIARERAAADATARVLADVLQRADDRAGALADFADAAHAAGASCERVYGSARQAVTVR